MPDGCWFVYGDPDCQGCGRDYLLHQDWVTVLREAFEAEQSAKCRWQVTRSRWHHLLATYLDLPLRDRPIRVADLADLLGVSLNTLYSWVTRQRP